MSADSLPFQYKVLCAGSSACFAELMSFPLDTAKVRLQIQGEALLNTGNGVILRNGHPIQQYHGLVHTISTIAKNEGFRSLFNGLTAGLQRQICFASIRIGLYDSTKYFYQNLFFGDTNGVNTSSRIAAGITTGGAAVLVAQPTDVVKVRFQASAARPSNARYKSTREAYTTILRAEGVPGLWKGTLPSAGRNSIVNVAEIVVYDLAKTDILTRGLMSDSTPCHFVSATVAGFCGTTVASPIDVVKTRYMNSSAGAYKSAVDCAYKTFKEEGVQAFFKGFFPSFCRLVSWNIVMWITYEKTKHLFLNNSVIFAK